MSDPSAPFTFPTLSRLATHVEGLDLVMGGGFLKGDTYLIVGQPGTGKTTLGNQLAFAHAAAGGSALVVTLVAESHDRMLAHLNGFAFADATLVGVRLRFLSFLDTLQDKGTDGLLEALWKAMRADAVTLLVIDSATVPAGFDAGPFLHRLQTRAGFMGCTTVLLAGEADGARAAGHVDGVIQLTNDAASSRDARWLRVAKLRGSSSLSGRHRFAIGTNGITVFPRLEAAQGEVEPDFIEPWQRVPTGVPGLDAMLNGGLPSASSTLVLGTPGAGKTLFGLHFLAAGAARGEPGLIAAFNETGPALVSTAERAGISLRGHVESGLIQVMWRPPLERSPDEWAWQLLAAVDGHRPRRLVVDAFTDLGHLFIDTDRQTRFASALANALRERQVTTLLTMELDSFASPELAAPVPNVSATMDNGILLRGVEYHSQLRRLVSILKLRQSGFDRSIREFTITDQGIAVGEALPATGLLTGLSVPNGDTA